MNVKKKLTPPVGALSGGGQVEIEKKDSYVLKRNVELQSSKVASRCQFPPIFENNLCLYFSRKIKITQSSDTLQTKSKNVSPIFFLFLGELSDMRLDVIATWKALEIKRFLLSTKQTF